MKNRLIKSTLILLFSIPLILNGQTLRDSLTDFSYFHISEGYYIDNDSTTALTNWISLGTNMLFLPARDSLIISIDIGGREKIFFMGMATAMENPGFEASQKDAVFYHWIFTSHIKEGIRNAYISKEYIPGSREKLGKRHYLIKIVFFDQTELQFIAYELRS
jgi:hypothetical protein